MFKEIIIPENDLWDETSERFIMIKEHKIRLMHSLVSISKWEAKWHKPYLSQYHEKTSEESLDYIKCMTVTQHVDPNVYRCIPPNVLTEVQEYINDSMTATTIKEDNKGPSSQILTSEVIYQMMMDLGIPFECQKWHLNRLLTLIKVCTIKRQPPQKMSRQELAAHNRALNAARKKQFNSKG